MPPCFKMQYTFDRDFRPFFDVDVSCSHFLAAQDSKMLIARQTRPYFKTDVSVDAQIRTCLVTAQALEE